MVMRLFDRLFPKPPAKPIAPVQPLVAVECPNCPCKDVFPLNNPVVRVFQGAEISETPSGKSYRCPQCWCAFYVTVTDVRRFGERTGPAQPERGNATNKKPAEPPPPWPTMPEDMSSRFAEREPE